MFGSNRYPYGSSNSANDNIEMTVHHTIQVKGLGKTILSGFLMAVMVETVSKVFSHSVGDLTNKIRSEDRQNYPHD